MKRITLITLAVAGLSFAAAPSYAQSSYGGNTGDSYGNTDDRAAAKAERKAEKVAKKAEKARMKAAQMKEDSMKAESMKEKSMMKDHSSATDAKMVKDGDAMVKNHSSSTDARMMKDGDVTMKTGDNMMIKDTPAVMQKSESMKPTNCPSGTEPKNDGTCMLK